MLKRTLYAMLICIFNACAGSSSYYIPTFNQAAFDANAALYGNKTANLIELNKIVNVPPFFGITSPKIIAYLKEIPHEAGNTWEYILMQWDLFRSAQSEDTTHLTDDARTALANIRKAIEHTYFDVNVIAKDRDRLDNLKTFLQTAIDQNKLLMVRSTGREDGKELSNAGGNASVASVPPTNPEQLSKAIQEVLSSYVSEKSISQRLLGKDPHLFDEPFMAVLLQVMTGEVFGIDTEIPKSGVMFSPEAEGETPGVVVIQATFGHNEGVVNGLVPVDTYYVGPTNIIHPVISIKRKRLAAKAGKDGLHFIDNDPAIQRVSTLNAQTVLALKNAAEVIQNYYGNAVDIEFVILNNIVYFVQARPLEAKKFQASYLKPEFIAQNNNTSIPVIPIGVGNAAVRIITNKDQLIIANNIRQALDTFLFKTPDQDAIQAVIINESAPATSHEATQFRRLGKPVLYLKDMNIIKRLQNFSNNAATQTQLIAASSTGASPSYAATSQSSSIDNNPLLIDAQRAVIIPFAPNDTFRTAQHTIELGWYAHPIAKKVSLIAEFAQMPEEDVIQKIGNELAPQEFFKGTSTHKLIDIIKETNDPEQARNALRSLSQRIFMALANEKQAQKKIIAASLEANNELIEQLQRIFACISRSIYETNEILSNPQASRLEKLYPMVFLEALIKQIPEPIELVDDYSLASILKTEKEEQSLTEKLNLQNIPFRAHITQYAKAGSKALVPEIEQQWNAYLQSIADINDPRIQGLFSRLMLNVTELNALPLWLNTSFEKAYEKTKGNPLSIMQTLLVEYVRSLSFIKELKTLQEFFVTFNISALEDPSAFEKQFATLKAYSTQLTTPEFIRDLDAASNLSKMAALQVMHTAVAIFDTSIKALTGSNLYSDEQLKVKRFKIMLQSYLELLKAWVLIPSIAQDLEEMRDTPTFNNLQDYIKKIEQFPADNNPKELLSSPGFNVAGAALGSKADWHRSAPNPLTLEDIFTLIHQNLLVTEGVFAKTTSLQSLKVPHIVNTLKNRIRDLEILTHKANLIGTSFKDNQLIYYYNLPQRHHSSTLQIIYDLKTHDISLAVQFIGEARKRWSFITAMLYLLDYLTGPFLEKPVDLDFERGALSFVWKIDTDERAIAALAYLQIFANYAINNLERVYGNNNFLQVIISQSNRFNAKVIAYMLLDKMAQQPFLLLYALPIVDLLGNEDLLAQKVYLLFMRLLLTAPKIVQQEALELLFKKVNQSSDPEEIKNFMSLLDKHIAPESISHTLLYYILTNFADKISLEDLIHFIKTKSLYIDDSASQLRGIDALRSHFSVLNYLQPKAAAPFFQPKFIALINDMYKQFSHTKSAELRTYMISLLAALITSNSPFLEEHRATVIAFVKAMYTSTNVLELFQTLIPDLIQNPLYSDFAKSLIINSINYADLRQQFAASTALIDLVLDQGFDPTYLDSVKPVILRSISHPIIESHNKRLTPADMQSSALWWLTKLVRAGYFIPEAKVAAASYVPYDPNFYQAELNFKNLQKAIASAEQLINSQTGNALREQQ